MNKYQKLISNTAILAIGTFASKVLVFLLMPLYTSCLSAAEYGTADLITQTANLIIPLLACGIVEAVFRFALDKKSNLARVFTTGFVVICAGVALFAILSPLLSKINYFGEYTALIIAYAAASCFHSLCAQFVRATGKTSLFAFQGILSTLITIILNIIFLVACDMGVEGYVLSVVFSDIAATIFLVITARLWGALRFDRFKLSFAFEMLKFSVPMIPTTIFWWITNVADRYMVRDICGKEINGLYAVAYKIPTLLILASGVFIEAWQFSAVTEKGSREHTAFFGKVMGSFQAMMFMVGSVLVAFSKIFTMLQVDPSYYTSWRYIPILSAATVFSSLVTFMGSVYLVEKKSILSFVTSFIGAGVNILLNLLLIPHFEAIGAAIATFFSYFVVYIIRAINSRSYIPFELHNRKVAFNTAVILLQSTVMILEVPFWIPMQILCVGLIVGVNIKPILVGMMKLIRRGR